jgi:hypothetical protein
MEDSCETPEHLQNRRKEEQYSRILIHDLLDRRNLKLGKHSIPLILNGIDSFASQSQANEIVRKVTLYPYSLVGQDDAFWDRVGRAIGNLQAVDRIDISSTRNCHNDDADEDAPTPDWDILARILSHVQQRITLSITRYLGWRADDIRSFARAIQRHPTITSFEEGVNFSFQDSDALYASLATLPSLESILHARPEDQSAYTNPESLTKLLRVPCLRSVCFYHFYFTRALCHATANALMKGTTITNLEFRECSFPAEECAAIMASGLGRNTSVVSIRVEWRRDEALFDALAAALPSNSTLRELSFRRLFCVPNFNNVARLSPVFAALGKNQGLKTLKVDVHGSTEESMCTAMTDGLGMNVTLESLELNYYAPILEENCALWNRAFSFLRTNKALKSLMVNVDCGASTESRFSIFRISAAAMLQDNASLESLYIRGSHQTKAGEYVALITVLQHNKTLKTLRLDRFGNLQLTDDEDKQMAALLRNNYAMESLPNIDLEDEARDVGAILRLNAAGRRYLVQDGSSVSKGVEVLSAVSEEINCVFLHLLENPRLCDRNAVEIVCTGESNSSRNAVETASESNETSPANENGMGY